MKEKLREILFILSLLIFIVGFAVVIWYFIKQRDNENRVKELKTLISEDTISDEKEQKQSTDLRYYIINGVYVQEKYKDIYLLNNDFIGWIEDYGTNIDYPVMYTPNDEQYYLRRNFDKEYSVAGTIFIRQNTDVIRPSENIILFGHHMDDGTMFQNLMKYESEEYYQSHKYIEFDTLEENATYEVIAAFRTVTHDANYQGFDVYNKIDLTKEKLTEYIDECKSLTPYKTIETSDDEELITLSTCAYHKDNGRYVVVAKKIKSQRIDKTKPPIEVINQ